MPVVQIDNLSHTYHPGTPNEKKALDRISLTVERGEILGIIGANGSGKSTLIQHLNGLLRPTEGKVTVMGKDTRKKNDSAQLWKNVGIVFQFPERQFFEATVFDEVAYGLKNLGMPPGEIPSRVDRALETVGLDADQYRHVPPLSLSGGVMRRVALANVLAMRPEILVLDEPTAGLDCDGRALLHRVLAKLCRETCATVILVSHCINDLALLCKRLAVLDQGRLKALGPLRDVLAPTRLGQIKALLPDYLLLLSNLIEMGWDIQNAPATIEEAADAAAASLKKSGISG